MHSLVRKYIKTGVGFLFLGLGVGLYMMVQRELFGRWPDPYLRTAHAHAVFFGFVIFVILGVALWLFPRATKDDTRYRPERVEAAYWILTISTAGRFAGEASRAWLSEGWVAVAVVLAAIGQILGVALYFHTMWTRIRSVGSHLREARGERF